MDRCNTWNASCSLFFFYSTILLFYYYFFLPFFYATILLPYYYFTLLLFCSTVLSLYFSLTLLFFYSTILSLCAVLRISEVSQINFLWSLIHIAVICFIDCVNCNNSRNEVRYAGVGHMIDCRRYAWGNPASCRKQARSSKRVQQNGDICAFQNVPLFYSRCKSLEYWRSFCRGRARSANMMQYGSACLMIRV